MKSGFLCFTKMLTKSDVERNLEIPNGSPFLPANDEVMLVCDRAGTIYQFRASERRGGRRSLTLDWHAFAVAKDLEVGDALRIYWLEDGNQYVVQVGRKLFGPHIGWLSL